MVVRRCGYVNSTYSLSMSRLSQGICLVCWLMGYVSHPPFLSFFLGVVGDVYMFCDLTDTLSIMIIESMISMMKSVSKTGDTLTQTRTEKKTHISRAVCHS
ncbi:hypothetical protein BU24DRAFT_279499 [Aaosphaeria arxii CBS 175.79]|uniref:Uncharacterized protein n=1 Tax=Aaosphaeria arxii CBS 175.79 TaxID=1450172 RepID=A0A6A5XEV8_9PLEO|nr:uncharacterized protein BU24DRAFT_279499 [Aaosphaeria arxii CBS 175.79]KAF2011347.1 hypothetical protein BU24DRAFT_279499 [Aaosphaeria arxii CBS 175.79]